MSMSNSSPRKKQIVTLGDLVVDLIAPVRLPILPNQHQEAPGMHLEPGGGNNVTLSASRLGLVTSPIGVLGDDAVGAFLLGCLQAEGITTVGIISVEGEESTLVLDLIDSTAHEHVFIGSAGRNTPHPLNHVQHTLVGTADAVFLQGYTLLEPHNRLFVPQILALAQTAQCPVFFDVGPTAKHVPRELLRQTMRQCNVVMMTEDEIPLAAEGLQGEAAYQHLFQLGVGYLVIKQGANGCTVMSPSERLHVPGFAVRVADTVGAGDCFDAAFMYGWLHNYGMRDCALLANATGAAVVQKIGAGRNVPTCAEVRTVLSQVGRADLMPCDLP
jgi:sugar/nucleoside kinase (ribokinase family)